MAQLCRVGPLAAAQAATQLQLLTRTSPCQPSVTLHGNENMRLTDRHGQFSLVSLQGTTKAGATCSAIALRHWTVSSVTRGM